MSSDLASRLISFFLQGAIITVFLCLSPSIGCAALLALIAARARFEYCSFACQFLAQLAATPISQQSNPKSSHSHSAILSHHPVPLSILSFTACILVLLFSLSPLELLFSFFLFEFTVLFLFIQFDQSADQINLSFILLDCILSLFGLVYSTVPVLLVLQFLYPQPQPQPEPSIGLADPPITTSLTLPPLDLSRFYYILCLILIVVSGENGALLIGRSFRRHFPSLTRPFSTLSPNKTTQGFIAQIITSAVACYFCFSYCGYSFPVYPFFVPVDSCFPLLFGLLLGCAATLGDLFESLLKRSIGVSTLGTLFPGVGGVLDRVDGLFFALPLGVAMVDQHLIRLRTAA
jgi:CDP-diglyceride synthetase